MSEAFMKGPGGGRSFCRGSEEGDRKIKGKPGNGGEGGAS